VKNAGFEQVEAGKVIGWDIDGLTDLDNAQFYAGSMGLRMRHAQMGTSTARQTIRCGEREYVALVWLRTEGVVGTGAQVRLLRPDGQTMAATPTTTGDSPWHWITVRFNPGNTGTVIVELSLSNASGTVWFDEVAIGDRDKIQLPEEPQRPERRDNIALGKPYALSPPPSYEYCTDPGDTEQLTDGKYTVGYFWTQKSTVGWYLYSPQVIIDLGSVQPIDGIMINCPGGGAAGVQFPAEISYFVSDDNDKFHKIARLTPIGMKQDGKSWYTHRFLADHLKTRGRYVMLQLDKAGSTVFADEVEVYKGAHDPVTVSFSSVARGRLEMAFAQYALTTDTYTRGHFPETPHVKWGIPLSGGPIKAIMMCYSDDMRDVVEVAQRLDIDYVPVSHYSFYRSAPLGNLMQEQIARALPSAQVMVVAGYRWDSTPQPLVDQIKARVREGMGLVCVTQVPDWLKPIDEVFTEAPLEGDQGILDAVPVNAIPGYHKPRTSHFHLAIYGKGRVAWYNGWEFGRMAHSLTTSFNLEDLDDDTNCSIEYSYVMLNKLIAWSAQRDVRRLTEVSATPEKVVVRVSPGGKREKLEMVIRDSFFDPVETKEVDVAPDGGAFLFQPMTGTNGRHYVDAWLRDGKGAIIDYGSTSYEIDRGTRIESVELSNAFYASDKPIEGSIKVTGELAETRVGMKLFDTRDRLMEEVTSQTIPANGDVKLRLEKRHPLTLALKLYVSLYRGDLLLENRFQRVWVELPHQNDYTVSAWYGFSFQPHAHHGLSMLRDLGVDTCVATHNPQNAAFVDLRVGTENVDRVYPHNKDDSRVRVPCLTDPEYRAKVAERVEKLARDYRPYGVIDWSMGDESTLGGRDYCVSPTCLAAFRKYLEKEYGSLEKLNAGWGTDSATWNDVFPMTRTEVGKRDNIAPWLDHRRYMESLFADYHAWLRDLVVENIPDARVGISGTPSLNSYSGHDWWKLMQGALDHLSGYGGIQRELQRSFLRPGTFYTTFLGYDYKDNDEQRARYGPWDLLFHAANGLNYYTLVSNTLNCPLVRPDMSLTRKAPWFFEEVKELKSGVGELFIEAQYESDGIAIHYSPPSVHTATAVGLFDPRDRLRNFNINLSNWGKILQQCHYQYNFIHADQMARGELAKYKLLILPWSSSISYEEAEAIKAFVRNGGTVLADSLCGVRDDHGKPKAMLDDVFGVRQTIKLPELQHSEMVLDKASPILSVGQQLGTVPLTSGVHDLTVVGGTPLGRAGGGPACVVNRYGKGRAIFVNGSFSNYAEVWSGGAAGEVLDEKQSPELVTRPIRDFVAAIVEHAGTARWVSVQGDGTTQLEVSRLSLGQVRLIGILRSIEGGGIDRSDQLPYSLQWALPAHVYDVRAGKYLGKLDKVPGQAARGVARVLAALPYRVQSLALAAKESLQQGAVLDVSIALKTDGRSPNKHVIRVTVAGPREKSANQYSHYAQNALVVNGSGAVEIPFALNDPAGVWTIEAKDVLTGVSSRLQFRLLDRPLGNP